MNEQLSQNNTRPVLQPIDASAHGLGATAPRPKRRRTWLLVVAIIIGAIIAVCGAVAVWYTLQLTPVNSSDQSRVRLEVVQGTAPDEIAALLEEKGVIRSASAFTIYTRLKGVQNQLQAGMFSLSPSESLEQIVTHLLNGQRDEFQLTFFPGATLKDTVSEEKKRVDVTTVLLRAGYSEDEVARGLAADYDHPLLASKPADAPLEGFVYGETYQFASGASVEQILTRTFDELYQIVQENNLEERYVAQGLTLYEGITLASIIQREVPAATDQKQVAQIFLKRYREGMQLGSDITAYYGADQIGVPRAVTVDTPFNTRIHPGLTPTPIATPGESALIAVAEPAAGDYVYFLSGDDEVTYFGRTLEEHEANIRNHCAVKCAMD